MIDAVHLQGPEIEVAEINFVWGILDLKLIKKLNFQKDKICGWFKLLCLDRSKYIMEQSLTLFLIGWDQGIKSERHCEGLKDYIAKCLR